MAVDMKQVARRLIDEVFAKGNVDVFDELCDPSYRCHDPLTGDADMRQQKENCRMYRSAFPDLAPSILGCFAEGDTVVTHWRMTGTHQKPLLGVQPTGKRCTCEGVSIDRFRGGKMVETWVQWDALGLMRQLGAAPSLDAGAAARPQAQPHA